MMERYIARLVVQSLEKQKGPTLTILEAMSMTKIASYSQDIYAVQKGDVTFLAWIYLAPGATFVRTKTVSW